MTFGEETLIGETPNATVRTVSSKCSLAFLKKEDFEVLAQKYPSLKQITVFHLKFKRISQRKSMFFVQKDFVM